MYTVAPTERTVRKRFKNLYFQNAFLLLLSLGCCMVTNMRVEIENAASNRFVRE